MQLANWRLIRELLLTVDVALELVDIRDPISTRSRRLEKLAERSGVPLIIVLNKADLVPLSVSKEWKRYFEDEGYPAVFISAQKRMGTLVLRRVLKRVVKNKSPLTAGIFGIPKVGKSTLINTLKGRHSASTSPYPGSPGYTKRARTFRIGEGVYLIDTPGLVPPEGGGIESKIREKPVDSLENPVAIAVELIRKILKYSPNAFKEAYGISSTNPDTILRELALMRGWVYRKDKEPIIQESAKAIIRDYLNGRIPFYITPQQLLGYRPRLAWSPVSKSR